MKLRNKAIRDLRDEIQELERQFNVLVKGAQLHCSHKHLGECDYKPLEILGSLPPVRICLSCGLTEEGWGCGYQVLTSETVTRLSRDELYSLRCGKIIHQ